ncbi:M28 family metallopeptidase [Sporosarcina luteola]|uniref:M28 family metallopeptidase n=1 Tax=Sporosarcina luteola TaxID=582850 RepID=UPI00203FC4CB|nr:M28 family metallopeptidase [Sporosarcina luteola]MCM3743237.1 M28 family metallopeptidase [Sporosarcina luteola]
MVHLRKVLIGAILTTIFLVGCNDNNDYGQLEKIIQQLTSDEMNGRLTGTRGNDLALSFIEEKFQEIGLEPLGANNETFLMRYPHQFFNPEKTRFEIQIISDSGVETNLMRGVDYLERTGFSNYEETLPFIFDIQSPEIEQSFIVLKDRSNYQEAFEKAKGIFIVEETLKKSLLIDSVEKPIIQITEETYYNLQKIAAGKISMNISVKEEMIDSYNIAGKIPGENNENAIVLSAHFDHVGSVGDAIYRGAIDNASGVAILLEVAKVLGSSNKTFENDIIIVAFNGEESGLQGSKHFVDELSNKYKTIYNINLDSLYSTPISIVSQENGVSNELLDDLVFVLEENSIDFNTDMSGGLTSDHISFLSNDMNALTISSQNPVPKIHHPLDTIKEIDLASLNKISDTIVEFINNYHQKEYTHSHDHDHDHENNISEVEFDYEFQETERSKLNHDEYTFKQNPKDKTYYFIENQSYTFTDLQEFQKYYPAIVYESIIDEYQINSIQVLNLYSEEFDRSELEENKVYSHELHTDDLLLISFRYSSNDAKQILDIHLSKDKGIPIKDSGYVYEETIIKGIPYTLQYSLDKDYLHGFSYEQELNGFNYLVRISKGEEVVSEFEGRQVTGIKTSLSEEDVKYFIEDINIDELVLKTLESF